jgi:hypothetical protein
MEERSKLDWGSLLLADAPFASSTRSSDHVLLSWPFICVVSEVVLIVL